jgi:cation transport protein ChaC
VRWPEPDADYYDRTATDVLAALPSDRALWIFAIGSLIWNPRFPVAERRPASIRGWHRAFCLGPDTRHRGNPEAPGLMMSLDRGGQCRGVVLRVNPDGLAASLEALLRKSHPRRRAGCAPRQTKVRCGPSPSPSPAAISAMRAG